MKEYVTKRVLASEMWPMMFEDWLKISRAISDKYGEINKDYRDVLSPRQQN
jgi:hypothetical protein